MCYALLSEFDYFTCPLEPNSKVKLFLNEDTTYQFSIAIVKNCHKHCR